MTDDRVYLLHIHEAAQKIFAYTKAAERPTLKTRAKAKRIRPPP